MAGEVRVGKLEWRKLCNGPVDVAVMRHYIYVYIYVYSYIYVYYWLYIILDNMPIAQFFFKSQQEQHYTFRTISLSTFVAQILNIYFKIVDSVGFDCELSQIIKLLEFYFFIK